MDFAALVAAIRATHAHCAAEAKCAVNVNLTLRNWIIGWYIVEYEQNGADRAAYGDGMVDRLSAELHGHGVPTCDRQRLYAYAAFYRAYPQVREVVPVNWALRWLQPSTVRTPKNVRSLTGQSQAAVMKSQIVRAPTGQCQTSGKILVERLSYTHLEHLGQLNTYVTWYRKHLMAEGDNPPVGLLLCTGKDHAFVEYALAGMDNRLFVSKYQLELPEKGALQRFLDEKRREIGDEGPQHSSARAVTSARHK
jgi:hypothetical protein